MSFRTRLTLVVAAAVALALVGASPVVYAIVRTQLRKPVDQTLAQRAAELDGHVRLIPSPYSGKLVLDVGPGGRGIDDASLVQLYTANGKTYPGEFQNVSLPVDSKVKAAAQGRQRLYFTDTHVEGQHVRMLVVPLVGGGALQIVRPLRELDASLADIRNLLLLLDAAGIVLAAILGALVARTALRPVRRLTEAAEHVSETRDLTSRIDVEGRDELSRLATTFNTMLGGLEESARAQRQLVTDASHELRTPLTSLRTNVEVLLKHRLEEPRRRELLKNVVEQVDELTALTAELVELARGEQPPAEPEDVRLDLLVAEAVSRARRNRPQVEFVTTLAETTVHGVPSRIERAVSNLLDNAGKWSPPDATVEVSVKNGEVVVRDHGPGIASEDLPFVFDRFYRAPAARGMPGSGLGLAIVKQVAEEHDGAVAAEQPQGGGTRMRLRLARAA